MLLEWLAAFQPDAEIFTAPHALALLEQKVQGVYGRMAATQDTLSTMCSNPGRDCCRLQATSPVVVDTGLLERLTKVSQPARISVAGATLMGHVS